MSGRMPGKLPVVFVAIIVALIAVGVIYARRLPPSGAPDASPSFAASPATGASPAPAASPSVLPSPSPGASIGPGAVKASNPNPDLAVDENGLSRATAVLTTSQGTIRFKFYPNDAPNTVKRIVELAHQGFYNGLTFHRVVPGFVIQTGDPYGNGTGGSGQKLKAEFNNRRHIEGTLAMARTSDPDSADSQFYITLGAQPHLDHSYTVFGQVIEGMDVAKRIKPGDKITSLIVE